MKICAIICELNPFHNGHEYLFREAKRITEADFLIAIMSGDFVQRGLPAICDKYSRTKMALYGGADLVIELPVIYSTASADYFAFGAVSALDSLGCVDFLCFGSETGDINKLKNIAKSQISYSKEAHILNASKDSYAKGFYNVTGNMVASNDMLAASYVRALYSLESNMEAVCIKRRGSGYLDDRSESDSATAIRKRICEHEGVDHLVPKYTMRFLKDAKGKSFPITIDDFSIQLFTRIDSIIENEHKGIEKLTDYMDVSDNIAGRIRAAIVDYTTYSEFVESIHSKEYTKSRILRALTHILIDIRKSDYADDVYDCLTPYARILGFKKESAQLLSIIKENSIIPVISKAKDAKRILDDETYGIFMKDIHAANLYEQGSSFKYSQSPVHDFSKEIVIVQ